MTQRDVYKKHAQTHENPIYILNDFWQCSKNKQYKTLWITCYYVNVPNIQSSFVMKINELCMKTMKSSPNNESDKVWSK